MSTTGPDFEVDQGLLKTFELTATEVPEDGSTAVLRLGRRVSESDPTLLPTNGIVPDADVDRTTYTTVLQDDCEIDGSDVLVSIDTSALAGLEYLWLVDLLNSSGVLTQRWRGLMLVTGALNSL